FQAAFTHNWTSGLTTTFSSEIYDGFIYNFEDNEFIAIDARGFRNWFLVRSRLSSDLSWRLKYTVDAQLPVTWIDVRNFSYLLAPAAAYTYLETAYGTPMIGLSSRGIGMGGAVTAMPDGSFSLVQNPAMLAGEERRVADLTLRGIRYDETRFVPLFDTFDSFVK